MKRRRYNHISKGLRHILAVTTVLVTLSTSSRAETINWKPAARDLEIADVALDKGVFFPSRLLAFRTSLSGYVVRVVRAEDFGARQQFVDELAPAAKASLMINASFFDERGDPLGLVVQRGIQRQGIHSGGSLLNGVFTVSRQGVAIVRRADFSSLPVLEAFQAGPILIFKGERMPVKRPSTASRRSGVCVDDKGRLIIFCVASGWSATGLAKLQDTLLADGMGCRYALNLDGGGSSQLYVSPDLPGKVSGFEGLTLKGTDAVPVALGLFVKAE